MLATVGDKWWERREKGLAQWSEEKSTRWCGEFGSAENADAFRMKLN
jgi:hypothetical protein